MIRRYSPVIVWTLCIVFRCTVHFYCTTYCFKEKQSVSPACSYQAVVLQGSKFTKRTSFSHTCKVVDSLMSKGGQSFSLLQFHSNLKCFFMIKNKLFFQVFLAEATINKLLTFHFFNK